MSNKCLNLSQKCLKASKECLKMCKENVKKIQKNLKMAQNVYKMSTPPPATTSQFLHLTININNSIILLLSFGCTIKCVTTFSLNILPGIQWEHPF